MLYLRMYMLSRDPVKNRADGNLLVLRSPPTPPQLMSDFTQDFISCMNSIYTPLPPATANQRKTNSQQSCLA